MDFIVKFGCPVLLTQTWQVLLFIAIPSVLAALGARLLQGSFLRIVGAVLGACARDAVLLYLVLSGHLLSNNPDYDQFTAKILICCIGSAAALGATFSPNRGIILWMMAALGALAGHWVFTFIPLVLFLQRRRNRNQALPL